MANDTTTTSSAGRTTIGDGVVAKVIGLAVREVHGVHDLGGGAARVVGAVRDAIGQRDQGQGVKVEVGEKQVAADITIVVDYPERLQHVAEDVRRAAADAITGLVGMQVAEVNVTVTDVFIPGQEDEEPSRVA